MNAPIFHLRVSKNLLKFNSREIAALSPELRQKYAQLVLARFRTDHPNLVPKACTACNRPGFAKIHGHHHDYLKPFEVVWICMRCHSEAHHPLMYKRHRIERTCTLRNQP